MRLVLLRRRSPEWISRMKNLTATICLTLAVLLGMTSHGNAQAVSDEQVKELIIRQSIASYSGRCPCPYNIMRNARRCGGRSAYSRPGGKSPICYKRDIPKSAVERYRKRFGIRETGNTYPPLPILLPTPDIFCDTSPHEKPDCHHLPDHCRVSWECGE